MTARPEAPSACWWCGKRLGGIGPKQRNVFATVLDPLGHEHRVHKICKPDADKAQRFASFMDVPTALDYDNDCAND